MIFFFPDILCLISEMRKQSYFSGIPLEAISLQKLFFIIIHRKEANTFYYSL